MSEWTAIKNAFLMAWDTFEQGFNKRFGWFFLNGRKSADYWKRQQ